MDLLQVKLRQMEKETSSVRAHLLEKDFKTFLPMNIARLLHLTSVKPVQEDRDVEQVTQTESYIVDSEYQENEYWEKKKVESISDIFSRANQLAGDGRRTYFAEFCDAFKMKTPKAFVDRDEFESYLGNTEKTLKKTFDDAVDEEAERLSSMQELSEGDYIRYKHPDEVVWRYACVSGGDPSKIIDVNLLKMPSQRHQQFYFASHGLYNNFRTYEVEKVPEKSVSGYIVSYFTPEKVVGTFRGDPQVFGCDGGKKMWAPREILTER